ncbi:hypothetical protein COO91_06916 [Nostoc flagelliforme CCNUN1]|uniref:Uncharacterized protein n=1 Tax=Nostoc flagelliforme CCNUN1 TaxID=2038116 RepID=A0A2K8SZS6_9NOSO|nr:hypothetical protein COO91_06916 [Nostoc flagelliforme CCNUN1]
MHPDWSQQKTEGSLSPASCPLPSACFDKFCKSLKNLF